MDKEPQREGGKEGGTGSRDGERVMRSEGLVGTTEVTDSSLPTLGTNSSSGTLISCPRSGMWTLPRDYVSLSREPHSAQILRQDLS